MTITQIVLTSGTSWTVPDDFDSNNNTIECLTSGASGANGTNSSKTVAGDGGNGGNGGVLTGLNNFSATPGTTLTFVVGAGATAFRQATWISNTGVAPTSTSEGVLSSGTIANCIGDYTFNGGGGGAGGNPPQSGQSGAGGAGGGAAGNASTGSGKNPGSMSPAWTGIGPGTGGNGGTGGNSGSDGNPGSPGTNYGAGGGGGGGAGNGSHAGGAGGAGAPGVIVIRYTPVAPSSGGPQFRAYVIG